MIEIAEHTTYRLRARNALHCSAPAPDFGIDPPSFLGSLAPPSAVCVDVHRGSIAVLNGRRRAAPHVGLTEYARESQVTLTSAVALRAHLARTPEELQAAHHLVRKRYAWRGYEVVGASDGGHPHPAPHRVVFLARDGEATVGTVTLGLDGEHGLMAEQSYPEVVHERRNAGASLCEVTGLAVAEEANSKAVLASLFSLAFVTASSHGTTDVLVEVNPRHVAFYRRVLGFAVAAGEKFCERVKAPSVLLWLAMSDLEQRLEQLNARVAASFEPTAQAA